VTIPVGLGYYRLVSANFFELPESEQISELTIFASTVLEVYEFSIKSIESINYEYNATFKVTTADSTNYALRININSPRGAENIRAEVAWVLFLENVDGILTPRPIANRFGKFVTTVAHAHSGRELNCILYSWLDGEEVGDEPTLEQLHASGQAMARMHAASKDFVLPSDSALPSFQDPFWETEDFLLSDKSKLELADKELVAKAFVRIVAETDALFAKNSPQIIHSDLHGWNMNWHNNQLSIFDFDDSGIGLPIQDIATALYYLDTPEQDEAMLNGYTSVRQLPPHTKADLEMLLIHRRLMLLNYLYETNNQEHQELIPTYLEETLRRLREFLNN
jgi:Ser/Thr protein kinase RdoA (MazF antagonist)